MNTHCRHQIVCNRINGVQRYSRDTLRGKSSSHCFLSAFMLSEHLTYVSVLSYNVISYYINSCLAKPKFITETCYDLNILTALEGFLFLQILYNHGQQNPLFYFEFQDTTLVPRASLVLADIQKFLTVTSSCKLSIHSKGKYLAFCLDDQSRDMRMTSRKGKAHLSFCPSFLLSLFHSPFLSFLQQALPFICVY